MTDLSFTTYVDGPFDGASIDVGANKKVHRTSYNLYCNQRPRISVHPSATAACHELAAYVANAKATGQTLSRLLHDALNQPYDNGEPCEVIGKKATLKIHTGELDGMKIDYTTPESLIFEYSNGCVMKKVAEHANLGHLIVFVDNTSIPMRPQYL
ncbi:hypothetical protein INT45_005276 [Circinella minor]|uniref:Uncharacterized protein n=1 Tax=Circinella minor TaxID=1195481 RepID=A0A8H7RW98_9FUNG|nr:hypothetical protein INT45_005276 [Circinella minor]